MKKNRNPYWDNLKLVLIFLVVLGHFLYPVSPGGKLVNMTYYWIYLFHMPAFVFVSGFFAGSYVKNSSRREEKLAGFLLLYVFFILCTWAVKLLFGFPVDPKEILSTSSAPWYMLAMFFWYLIIPFASRIKPVILFPLSLTLGLIAGVFPECGNFLALSRTIVFFPFFLAGYYFDGSLTGKIRPWMKVSAALFLIVCALFLLFRFDSVSPYLEIIYANRSYSRLKFSNPEGILYRFLWYGAASAMTAALIAAVPRRRFPFTYIGERTMSIFVLHRLIRDLFICFKFYRHPGSDLSVLLICTLISVLVVFITSLKPAAVFFGRITRADFLMKPAFPETENKENTFTSPETARRG